MNTYQKFLKKQHKVRIDSDFRDLVYSSAIDYGQQTAFQLRDRTITYEQLKNDYQALAMAMLQSGLKNKRIAVIGENSYAWILTYLAASSIGVVVPIDKELSHEDMENFMDAAACSAVVADEKIMKKLQVPEDVMKLVISSNGETDYGMLLSEYIEKGYDRCYSGKTEFDDMHIDAEKMSILIFTSGTTGNAKGVMLSQKNILSNIVAIGQMVKVDHTRHALSVLPLHHTYEATIGHLLLLSSGSCISYCDGLKYVGKNIAEYKPSVLIVVPLLMEFMLKTIDKSVRQSLPAKFNKGKDVPFNELFKALPGFLKFIVKRKVRKTLGGNLRLMIVGAAAIKPETIEAFELLGMTTYQGYGLTECSPLLAGNNDFFSNIEAVGLPIHGVEIKIEEPDEEGIGEIVAKGDNIMLGYYNDPEGTAEVMRGGYFHTGDLGKFDEEGFLYITGRCKSVIVTRNGKNIYPEELETRLMDEAIVEEVLVVGVDSAKKDDIVVKAKIYPCHDELRQLHKELTNEIIVEEIKVVVDKINDKLPAYKKIKSVEIVSEPFEKTTTKKIKRFGSNIE